MPYAHERYWITFNGEIYNYVELREELMKVGKSFRSTSDTEVILAAYAMWGVQAFARFRGMWAFAIYDREKEELVVCRDRLGIKPLYYYENSNVLSFASEIKQFTTLPGFVAQADAAVVKQYVQTGFERTDRTFFRNVHPVLPGTFRIFDLKNQSLGEHAAYWNPEGIKPIIRDARLAARLFGESLEESLKLHLRSDVPVGCQLSGGLDSSSVFHFMEKHYQGEAIHSFTIRFPGFEKDESVFVERMLKGSRALPHVDSPSPSGFLEQVEKFIWHHDEPVGSFAHYAGFVLARLIAAHGIKVVLNGQGGDELLGGYWQQYYAYLQTSTKRLNLLATAQHVIGSCLPGGNAELVRQLPAMVSRYRARQNEQALVFTKPYQDVPSLQYLPEYLSMDDPGRRVFEIRKLILPRLLKWDDRNLMAFGIEGRYPFLDHRVIEQALQFDTAVLYKNGWTKYPLRLAMKGKLPKAIYYRKSKWGFETPQQKWLAGPLRSLLQEWIGREKAIDHVLDPKSIAQVGERFWRHGNLEDAQMLLRLYLLDRWFEIFSVRS
jgi:asparagine synthase (glutamine-hydrolysing)